MLRKFGCHCRAKLNCLWAHKPQLQQWFESGQLLLRGEGGGHGGMLVLCSSGVQVCDLRGQGRWGNQGWVRIAMLVVVAAAVGGWWHAAPRVGAMVRVANALLAVRAGPRGQ